MAKQDDRLEAARAAAVRVLATLPRAVENLESNVSGVEAVGISAQSVERLAEGFREVVRSLEAGTMGKEFAGTVEAVDSLVVAESVESAANSIQSFVSSIEAAGVSDIDRGMLFKLGKLSGAANLFVETLESSPLRDSK